MANQRSHAGKLNENKDLPKLKKSTIRMIKRGVLARLSFPAPRK